MQVLVKAFFAALVLIATGMQMRLAIVELRESRKDSLEWLQAEDELVAEKPQRRMRREARRALRGERSVTVQGDLRRMKQTVVSWAMLTGAAGGALAGTLTGLL